MHWIVIIEYLLFNIYELFYIVDKLLPQSHGSY